MSSDHARSIQQKEQMFEHLLAASQWDRAIQIGNELLSNDPEDAYVHQMMALAAIETKELKLADHHSKAAIQFEPEDTFSHLMRARYFTALNRPLLAQKSFLEALRLDPQDADLWSAYGWNCYARGDMHTALKACETARQLDPIDVDIQSLEAAARSGIDDTTRIDAYQEIAMYEEDLKHDPENASTFYNIGIVYLDELYDGKNAMEWLREATTLEPRNKAFQNALVRATCLCHPLLKLIDLPITLIKRGFVWADDFKARQPWLTLLLLPTLIIPAFVFMIAGSLWLVFLYLPSKLFRWIAYPELISKATGQATHFGGFYRIPFWLRCIVFAVVSCGIILGIGLMLTSNNFKNHSDALIGGTMLIGMIIGICIAARKRNF